LPDPGGNCISLGDIQEAEMVVKSKLFKTNRSQAVRIPKAVAFPEGVEEVEIVRTGSSRIITPVGKGWADYFENGPFVTEDFMADRENWDFDEREPL
jgi:antitoxin VapB